MIQVSAIASAAPTTPPEYRLALLQAFFSSLFFGREPGLHQRCLEFGGETGTLLKRAALLAPPPPSPFRSTRKAWGKQKSSTSKTVVCHQ